jgi:glutamine amidotransferase
LPGIACSFAPTKNNNMCELLAFNFNRPITPTFTFDNFISRSEYQPHGWGIASYPDNSAQIYKSTEKAAVSRLARFLQGSDEICSRIIISHIRYATHGSLSHANTHPFHKKMGKLEWTFMHNGTLQHYKRGMRLKTYLPTGETDSEHAFCFLMQQIRRERNLLGGLMPSYDFIESVLQQINAYGRFNAVFSDSESLYVYHDMHGYNGLRFTERTFPFSRVVFRDSGAAIDLSAYKTSDTRGYIIATAAQTDGEVWQSFTPGKLAVFKAGMRIK